MPRLLALLAVGAACAAALDLENEARHELYDDALDEAVGFVLGLLYASQRRRPVPATLYRVASKEVDAKGLADMALAEVV